MTPAEPAAGANAPDSPDAARAEAAGGREGARSPREEVLDAAAQCFMEKGFGAASIDDVARRMGATKGRVYHWYRSKLDLFVDVVRYSLELIHEQTAAAAAAGPPEGRMARMLRAHLRSILRDRPYHRVALQGVDLHLRAATTPEQREALAGLIALRDRHQRLFEKAIAEGVELGLYAPCDVPLTARTMLAAANGAVFWYRPREGETEADRNELIEKIAAYCLHGLHGPAAEKGEKA
ncbi:TetR/AcrR family transcriptional regulator [Oceanicella actignis]|uniref:Transcriptional regulator, TetR family n=1 Tax=Oceanicella actignis TaxID=1189325 RepID=A0A1M7S141_9RHOB|nr:TetR/AcrR family transcriptional regulator [Oceanicella actignis]SES92447.1 transcriptional regulator, TetR family [Oceanicella actignis]SHN52198.1 transcriptional regulator, TetR family [Oceanicella actignis]